MKRILGFCMLAAVMCTVVSCKKKTFDELVGTVWKAPVDMNVAVPPGGNADSQYYYTLRFYVQGRYSLVMEDSKGNIIENRWQGVYQREEKEDKEEVDIVLYVNQNKEIFKYHPKEKYMYSSYFEEKFIKQ